MRSELTNNDFATAKPRSQPTNRCGHITRTKSRPAPGSADLCLVTAAPPQQVLAHLTAEHVTRERGPVPRTGARGPITSIYVRDPDGNLIEIASYPARLPDTPARQA